MNKKLNRRTPVRVYNRKEEVNAPVEELLVTVGTLCETSSMLIHSFPLGASSEKLVEILNNEEVRTPMVGLLATVGTLCTISASFISAFRHGASSEELVPIINVLHKNIDKRIQLLLKSLNN